MAKRKGNPKRKMNTGRMIVLMSLGLVAMMIVILGFLFIVQSIVSPSAPQETPIAETPTPDPVYPNDYDWQYLKKENDRFVYEDSKYTSRTGIDVSYSQGDIDWDRVRADGIDFAIIRAGYRGYETGELHEDAYFRYNIENAVRVGMDVGVYFFSQAISAEEAKEEAEFVLDLIKGYPVLSVAFDLEEADKEGRIADNSRELNTAGAISFSKTIKAAGYTPLVYGSASWMTYDIRMWELQDMVEFWMAAYGWEYPKFPYVFSIWQYSSTGHVDGISTIVDMNLQIMEK